MGFYEQRIFPRLNDFAMSDPRITALKKEALAGARGRVLEVGIGTGLNLPLYPPAVESLVGIDPNPGMNRRAAERAKSTPFPVEIRGLFGESLPFGDESFDTAVSTMVLCSIADPGAALSEIRRVLKPAGRYLFLEHGRSDDPRIARWQRRLNPLQRIVACGCELDRQIPALLEDAGFRIPELRTLQAEGAPKTHGFLYLGVALPA